MSYKIYLTREDGTRPKIFYNADENENTFKDYFIFSELSSALRATKTLQEVIDEHNDSGTGTLLGCTIHLEVVE